MHKLLARQLRRSFGVTSEAALKRRLDALRIYDAQEWADGIESLIDATEKTYEQYDRDLLMRTRMLEISSDELTSVNQQLQATALRQQEALVSLQISLQRLTHGDGASPTQSGVFDDDLLRLTRELEVLVRQREAARAALAESEARNRNILENLREVIFQTNKRGHWTYLNPAWTEITGFPIDESLGERALSYVHPEDRKLHIDLLMAMVNRQQDHFRQQIRWVTEAGEYRWLEVYAKRIENAQGRVSGVTGSLIDISEQKLAQDKLMISQERLNQALVATNSRLWDWDLTQPQPYVDPKWGINLGYDADDPILLNMKWNHQLHPDDLVRWHKHLHEHLHRQRPELDIELRFMTRLGDWRHASLRGKVVAWRGRRALRMAGMLLDITARKEAEEAARRQQELTEQILDKLPISVFLKDRSGRLLRFNRQFELFSKRSREEMLGNKLENFASQRWIEATKQEDEQAWQSGQLVTTERRLANVDPPTDLLVSRIVIDIGAGESYLLGFSIDISEQRAAREAMQRAVESAEAASRAKSEFLANMSHEIRTPMNGIIGMTELALETDLNQEQHEYLSMVKASADALLVIINDILDFSKIEAGKLDMEEIPFDLKRLVSDSAKSLSLHAHQKGLELICDLPADLPRYMKGDPGRLRQVLLNLLGNAIKFTRVGEVALSLRVRREEEERCEIEFSVRDTGIGIPLEKQALIFEAFSQVDGSTTRQYGGTGLGLTICKRLVILMQGQMSVHSVPGVGSTFSFTVQLRQSGVMLPPPLALGCLAGLGVLIVDDNNTNRCVLTGVLGNAGMLVAQSCNGEEALTWLRHNPRPALVILDGDMPALDGFSTAKWILQQPDPPLIILLTSADRAGDGARARELGVDRLLVKPVSGHELVDLILTLFGEQALELPRHITTQRPQAAKPELAHAPTDISNKDISLQILLVEDNQVNQRLALRLFEKLGHQVTLVDNGLSALEYAKREEYDLIFMDLQMPGMDGIAATRHIRQWEQEHGGQIPIIAMTARAMQGDRERCLEAGMNDYMSKPIHSGRLRQVLAQYQVIAPPMVVEQVLQWRSALMRLDGEVDLLLELAEIFLVEGPELVRGLHEALRQGDFVCAEREVHSLKGVLVNFGAHIAVAYAERLEIVLEQVAETEDTIILAEELEMAVEDVFSALRVLIANGVAAVLGG